MKPLNSIVLLLLICTNGALAGISTSFESVRAQSRRDARAPEGMAWEQRNAGEGGTKLSPIISECQKAAPEGKEDDFSLLVSLSKRGVPLLVLVSPETKFSECVRQGFTSINFSDAPWEGYWLEINMSR